MLNRLLAGIDVDQIEEAHVELIRSLIRKKKLLRFLNQNSYHYLMRIAHALNVLAACSAALIALVRTLGVRGFIDFVRETMAGPWLDVVRLREARARHYQLRLE